MVLHWGVGREAESQSARGVVGFPQLRVTGPHTRSPGPWMWAVARRGPGLTLVSCVVPRLALGILPCSGFVSLRLRLITAGERHQELQFLGAVKGRHWRCPVIPHRKIYATAQGYMLSRLNHLVAMGTRFMLVLLKLEKLDGKHEYFRFLAVVSFTSFASSTMSDKLKYVLTVLVKRP